MNIEDQMESVMEKLDELLLNQDRLERLLLTITPYRRLPVDLQRRAAHLQNLADSERAATGDRVDTVKRMFAKLAKFSKVEMEDGRWPKILAHTSHPGPKGITLKGGVLGAVPYSALVNRCVALKCFALSPGDVTPKANVEEAIRQAGLVTKTMHDAGLVHQSKVMVIMDANEGWKWRYGLPTGEGVFIPEGAKVPQVVKEKWSGEEDEDDEVPIRKFNAAEFLENEKREAAKPAKVKKPNRREEESEPVAWAGISLDPEEETQTKAIKRSHRLLPKEDREEEETFETSECAQGLTTTRNLVEPDEDVVVEDDEDEDEDSYDRQAEDDLHATYQDDEDDEDNDLGPDEEDFPNPIREQFEREANEAWAREEAALASGELVLVDGIPVSRKARK